MFCNQCGGTIPDRSRFCNHCGAAVASLAAPGNVAVETYSPTQLEEQTIFVLRPTMIFIILGYILAGIIALAATAGVAYMNWPFWVALIVSAVLLAFPGYFHLMRQSEIYMLTNHKIEISYGLIAKTTRNIPLRSIQDVTTESSIFERLLGLGNVVIDSAAVAGKISFNRVPNPTKYADRIMQEIRKRN